LTVHGTRHSTTEPAMSISRRNNRALNRVLRDSLRARPRSEPPENTTPCAPAYTLSTDIPDSYNDSYVNAIPKDPQNTFVYWEMPAGQPDGSLFADKGTAHVGNDEAVRIGQQLNEKQRQRQADNPGCENGGYQQEYRQNHYHQVNWDNGSQYNFGEDNQQHHHNADKQYTRNNDNQYRLDDAYQYLCRRHQDDTYNINWDDGNQYCRNDGHKNHDHYQNDIYQLIWNDGGNNAPRSRSDDAAFSEMLENFIARCNKHIADYRHCGESPLARALSSGLLSSAGKEKHR